MTTFASKGLQKARNEPLCFECFYDAFGNTISQFGPLAEFFRHRFSTKYYDSESGLYYYGYRFYHPALMRWLNRDPLGEEGGHNIYSAFRNSSFTSFDSLGQVVYVRWHLPGDDLLYKWSSSLSAAETHFQASKVEIVPKSCGSRKISYFVKLTPPFSKIDVYFRHSLSPFALMVAKACEEEHVALYMEYDKCIEEFKRRVERICACKKIAEEEKQRALDWLNDRARHYREQNEVLDKPGGPHGH